ncbi:MAG: hypothetical protein IT381_11825 [Deltaproteobacteria bacterium]|nr:hypothetical protein [Deltaproteobacteria bacterium]
MRVSADTVSSDIGATEIGIAPPLSARSRLPLSFREAANESGAVDGFDATVATGNVSGARTRSRPEPVVPGPIPEADQPRDAARDIARVVTIVVGLGAIGIITEVEIRAVPAFNLEEHVRRTTFEDAFDQAHIEERVAAHDHFQMIWTPHADTTFLVERDRTDLPASAPEWADAPREENPLRLLAANAALGLSAIRALRPLMMRLLSETARSEMLHRGRSDAILTRPAGPMQRETEYAFPIARASEAMYALREAVEEEGLLMNFPCCMRFVRGDDIMLSPANRSVSGGEGGGDSAYISVLLTGSSEEDDRVMHVVQRVMREHGGRPHWGKELDLTAAEAREEYGERYDRFRALLDVLDPTGTFRNPYIDRFFPR